MTATKPPEGGPAALALQGTATGVPISDALRSLLVRSFTVRELRELVALLEAEDHVPCKVARELAQELGDIFAAPPLETDKGTIYNRPTPGWHRRRAERIAEARAS